MAVKTGGDKVFIESVDCREVRAGLTWIIDFLVKADVRAVVVDGANGQQLLAEAMKENKLKAPVLPTVKEIIAANASFEQGLFNQNIRHMGQPSLVQAVSNCEKRAIGTNGGFGYKSLRDDIEVALLDSVVLAYWKCNESKEKRKQRVSY